MLWLVTRAEMPAKGVQAKKSAPSQKEPMVLYAFFTAFSLLW